MRHATIFDRDMIFLIEGVFFDPWAQGFTSKAVNKWRKKVAITKFQFKFQKLRAKIQSRFGYWVFFLKDFLRTAGKSCHTEYSRYNNNSITITLSITIIDFWQLHIVREAPVNTFAILYSTQ